MHSVRGASQHRLHVMAVADGYRVRARRAGLTAVSRRRDPVIPAIAGAEEPTTHARKGEAVASSRRAHVRGSGTDARACVVCRLWRGSISGGLVDAGGTVLIDPS